MTLAMVKPTRATRGVATSVEEFCSQAFSDIALATSLVRQTTYWVYDSVSGNYGPGKFVGLVNMSYDAYRQARDSDPPEFDGGRTRRAIESATGQVFDRDDDCAQGLNLWAEEILGKGTLDGVDPDKWRFLRLSVPEVLPPEFLPTPTLPPLIKTIGKSQHQDGVRIDKRFHDLFNPPKSPVYVSRGNRRSISVLFNEQVFPAHYVYEGTQDQSKTMQRIQFGAALREEFKKIFPDQRGQFAIQAGADLNRFLFRVWTASQHSFAEDLKRRVKQSRQDNQEDRQKRLHKARKTLLQFK